ncbi:uncharacterized protein A4U43_C05F18910 [Asparagus officinalis]|uniref:Uncharacterized protein n=1 Tax=Asparagus officinalis TaxID=4686 RepID=A0A5P1ETD8_ASPOF|nr:uncharacterized protein A4U43_C05F18910 [Asparagus officinalis]
MCRKTRARESRIGDHGLPLVQWVNDKRIIRRDLDALNLNKESNGSHLGKRQALSLDSKLRLHVPQISADLRSPPTSRTHIESETDAELGTSSLRLPAADFENPTSDLRLPVADAELGTSDLRLPAADFKNRPPTPAI